MDPQGPATAGIIKERIFRSGSWLDAPQCLRSAYRESAPPANVSGLYGFRVVLAQVAIERPRRSAHDERTVGTARWRFENGERARLGRSRRLRWVVDRRPWAAVLRGRDCSFRVEVRGEDGDRTQPVPTWLGRWWIADCWRAWSQINTRQSGSSPCHLNWLPGFALTGQSGRRDPHCHGRRCTWARTCRS